MRAIPLVAIMCIGLSTSSTAAPLPDGTSEQRLELRGEHLTVFTYRPACRDPSLLIVFHGQSRNAEDYRDWARPLADRLCMLVVAPRFSKTQFPGWRYQRGGIVEHGTVQDPREWTGRIAVELAEHIQQQEGRKLSYSLIGHSAGGQYLSRLSAFTPTGAQRIVIANPGTHVLPDLNVKAPYGFGGVYAPDAGEKQLQRYLATPITIFLGKDDTTDEGGLSTTREAKAQGASRYERGISAFKSAQTLAQARGWTFNWRLVEVPGVAHNGRKMLAADEAVLALKP
jgi:predicted esterase